MRRLALGVLLSVCVALPATAQIEPDAVQATFEAQVHSSFGTVFTDCFRFNAPRAGLLFIDGFGTPLLFRFGDLNTDRFAYQAITRTGSGAPFAIMFHGKFPSLGRIKGQALNEFGDTFVLAGERNDSCPNAVSGTAQNWRSR